MKSFIILFAFALITFSASAQQAEAFIESTSSIGVCVIDARQEAAMTRLFLINSGKSQIIEIKCTWNNGKIRQETITKKVIAPGNPLLSRRPIKGSGFFLEKITVTTGLSRFEVAGKKLKAAMMPKEIRKGAGL